MKNLYRGSFNLNRFPVILYAWAHSERQAWATMCRRIAKRDGVNVGAVMGIFNGERDNYKIEIELETKEALWRD